jgi:hypothetical protein
MKIHELDLSNKDDLSRWDLFVDETMEGTVYHKSFWLLVHKDVKLFRANKVKFLVATRSNNQWVAGIPITYRTLFGKNFILMPYLTPYLGPIYRLGNIQKTIKLCPEKRRYQGYLQGQQKNSG